MRYIRFTDLDFIDDKHIEEQFEKHDAVIVQYSKPIYSVEILAQLNKIALINRSNFCIRFYAHNGIGFDCKVLENIPDVKYLALDCLTRVQNIEVLKSLNFLEKITIGIFELEDLDILSYENLKKVNKLSILDTKSKALNLEYLRDYTNLTDLLISGHVKNINSIAHLIRLNVLTLHSISKVPLGFINNCKFLKTLYIGLGGRDNINEIEENEIEELGLIWIRGLNDLSALSCFKKLRILRIEDEIRLKEINFPELNFLDDIKILNCKTLEKISGLENLKSLTNLRIAQTNVDFDDFLDNSKFPPKLKTLAFYTWKAKLDKQIRARLDARGFDEFGESA